MEEITTIIQRIATALEEQNRMYAESLEQQQKNYEQEVARTERILAINEANVASNQAWIAEQKRMLEGHITQQLAMQREVVEHQMRLLAQSE